MSDEKRSNYFPPFVFFFFQPDITFFGEGLPPRFNATLTEDFEKCDLLLVMGSSLAVAPFCTLIHRVKENCPRVLINMEAVSESDGGGTPSHPIIEALDEIFKTSNFFTFFFCRERQCFLVV